MGLQDLAAEIPKIGRLQIYRTSQEIVKRMKIYPPTRFGQTYVRTYRLRDGWRIIRKTEGFAGYTIQNRTPYTKYVVGNAAGLEQAWMHRGRWPIFRSVSMLEVNKLSKEINKHIVITGRQIFSKNFSDANQEVTE